jgi:lipopolysaccharide export system permease protein
LPLLLYTYLISEILAPTFGAFIILNCVLFLGKIFPLLDTLLDFGIGLPDLVRLLAYIAPQLFLFTIPMSCMIGMVIGLSRLGTDSEIMILKASGIGAYKLFPPAVIIALVAALLTGFFSILLIPAGNQALGKLMFQLAKEKIDTGLREKHFSDAIGGIVLYADRIDKETKQWHGVYVTDTRNHGAPITVMANQGHLSADLKKMVLSLALTDGSLHRTHDAVTQDIQFKRYLFNLSLVEPGGMSLQKNDRRNLSLTELQRQTQKLGRTTEPGMTMLIEYHKRLVLPVGCFILALLGFPLGFLAKPGKKSIGMTLGLGLFIIYYILITAAKALSETFVLPVELAMWTPNGVFLVITAYLIHSTARETMTVHLEKGQVFVQKLCDRLSLKKG